MNKRNVYFYKYEKAEGETHHKKVLGGVGLFHEFGCDYEEFDSGAGNYSTAIIELEDGAIKNIPVELVVFKT